MSIERVMSGDGNFWRRGSGPHRRALFFSLGCLLFLAGVPAGLADDQIWWGDAPVAAALVASYAGQDGRHLADLLAQGKIDAMVVQFDAKDRTSELPGKLAASAALFPGGAAEHVDLVGFDCALREEHIDVQNGTAFTCLHRLAFRYTYVATRLLVEVEFDESGRGPILRAIKAHRLIGP